ncbi:MAG: glutamine--fructose-6-phosphate transaminase (isomerizing) [Methanoregulaceae archaeon]|nr:glutamine--fructose-6-phosphate transaminase (isomerizing) [Methanoregulaceae archaeon]
MCGIIGYTGSRRAAPVLVEGLKRLEYRGYDSFGVATIDKGVRFSKHQGRIFGHETEALSLPGKTGIGHTRWATHGVPNDINAHPHLDCRNEIAVVHNGIIENYAKLRDQLTSGGHLFRSDTDTEVIVHLLEENYKGDLLDAVQKTIPLLQGSFALLALAAGEERIVAAREKSPLVLGVGDGESYAASDITPLLEYTERVIFLEDGDTASLVAGEINVYHQDVAVVRPTQTVGWAVEDVKRGGFPHFMLKEIYEGPEVFSSSTRAVTGSTLPEAVRSFGSATVVACGSSYHAGLLFRYILEEEAGIPVRVDQSSEFKYYPAPVEDLVIGITQSGETADTLAALRVAKAHNCTTLGITNVLGSSVTRLADYSLYMRAGPEISVAATKSFIAEIAVLLQLTNILAGGRLDERIVRANRAMEEALILDLSEAVLACKDASSIFYVARGPFYPIALEGALKMKEVSYIHAEGFAAGEIKHGPFALLSPETPIVAIAAPGRSYPVMVSNIKEMKARGTPIIALGEKDDRELAGIVDLLIPLPGKGEIERILSATVILQLLAYRTASALGREIDRPRNLAKSVTVE